MSAVRSCCFRALIHGLGSSSSPRLVSAADRHVFPFSNDRVGNFLILRMVHNKGISPLQAKPRSTVQSVNVKITRIKFELEKKDYIEGEHFLVEGDDPMIGAVGAVPMKWSEERRLWLAEMVVPSGETIEFQFILKSTSGDILDLSPIREIDTWISLIEVTTCASWEKLLEENNYLE